MLVNVFSSPQSLASLGLQVNKFKAKVNLFQFVFFIIICFNPFEYRKAPELYKPRK